MTDGAAGESEHSEEDALREYIEQKYCEARSVPLFVPGSSAEARDNGTEWKEAYDLFRAENAAVADTLASTAQQTEDNVCGFAVLLLAVVSGGDVVAACGARRCTS